MQCTEISKLPTSQTTPSERDSAALLLARARAHRGATEAALGQLSEVLAARPAHAEARLLQLDILHRSGDESALDDAMAAARTSVPAGDDDAGVALCQCASSTGSMSTLLSWCCRRFCCLQVPPSCWQQCRVACRAMYAQYKHETSDVLRHANRARRSPAFAKQATRLMVATVQQPFVDALWAGQEVAAERVSSAVHSCCTLLDSLPPAEQATPRSRVRLPPDDLASA